MTITRAASRASPPITAGTTMRVIVQNRYGPSREAVLPLAETGRPAIGDDEVLVDVIVSGDTDERWLGGSDGQLRAQLLSPFVSQKLGTCVASENAEDLTALRQLIDAGAVIPPIERIYPLAQTAAAIRRLLDGRAAGKVVVHLAPPSAHEESTRRQP